MVSPLHILMVEDSDDDAQLIMLQLEQDGLEAEFRRVDTEAAFRAALNSPPDLILSDFSMPRFNGIQALKIVKEQALDIPFILVSGTIGEEVAVEAMKNGADDYLIKDRLTRLGPAIQRALNQKHLREEKARAEEQIRYQALLLENVSDAVISTDMNGVIKSCNKAAEKLFGYTESEVIGQIGMEVLNQAEYLSTSREEMLTQLNKFGTWKGEVRNFRKDGLGIYSIASISIIKDGNGNNLGYLLMNHDISERKQAEE